MNEFELTGRTRTHVVELEQPRCTLHYAVVAAYLAMRDAAACAGIGLEAASSFRDFDRQLRIWNAKPGARAARLAAWSSAPSARAAHPREEHLLPLMVIVALPPLAPLAPFTPTPVPLPPLPPLPPFTS